MTPVKGSVLPPILDGRAPIQPDEVTLGAKTMRDTGRSIGDLVDVRVGDTTATLRVVGKAVFPVLGTFDVDGLGEGALFTGEGLRRVVPGAQQNIFVVRLAAAADPAEAKDSLSRALGEIGGPAGPQAPSTVADLGRVDDMPLILSGLLAGMASVTLAHALVITVSRRRRDLAVLKTLGFVRRQVRATVAWQATTMTALALVAGLPLGIATGRWAWHLFGDALGIVPEPVVPALVVVLIVPAALVAANLVAAVPAWAAARTRPSAVLGTE
jgi:hypothetical protein